MMWIGPTINRSRLMRLATNCPNAKPTPDAPDAWVFYVEVTDAQETTDLAKKSGGSVIVPPMPLPPIGTVAWLADPTGAVFGILQPSEPTAQ